MKIFLEQSDENHGLTIPQLIALLKEYGIKAERKSLYDDMEALRVFGIDIACRREKTFQYFVANRTFQLPELKLLVDAVQSSRFITHKKSNELIKKVESLASVYEGQQLQRQVYVSNRNKAMNESIYYNVDTLHTAILGEKKIRFQYFEWVLDWNIEEKVKRRFRREGAFYEISPWALTWDDENYYLVGFDTAAKSQKHFRIDKMANIQILEEVREGQEQFSHFDTAVYAKRVFGMFGGEEEMVQLCFANRLIGVVMDRFGREAFLTRADDTHFYVHTKVVVSPQFLSWVFGFGQEVKIVGPKEIAQLFVKHLEKTQSLY